MDVSRQLAQSAEGAALPYLGFQILKLEQGQVLNQHRDYHDSKSAKPVNLRLAAGEIQAVEAHREIFAEHVTLPMPTRTSYSETASCRSGHLRL